MSILTLAIPVCHLHGVALSGGPVTWHCPLGSAHGHSVFAADIDLEVAA